MINTQEKGGGGRQITPRLFDKASRNHIILYLPVTDMRNILWIFGRVSLQVTLKTIYVIDVALCCCSWVETDPCC